MAQTSVHEESYDSPSDRRGVPTWLKALWALGLVLVVFLGGMTAGIMVERQNHEDSVVLDESWQQLGKVITHLESDSYYRPDPDQSQEEWRNELERRAIQGLLEGSGDSYAAFLPPEEAAASSAQLTGEYEGVGVSIAENPQGEIEVVSIMVDSPAARADVRVGDVVEAVEATPIPEGDLELASTLLRGNAGTDVSIELSRTDAGPYDVTLTRERISTGAKTVSYAYLPSENVAVIQISLFALTTTGEIDEALELAREDDAGRLVLDLRGNPGGWVSEARNVIGRFVDPDAGPALLEDTWPAGDGMIEVPIGGGEAGQFQGEVIVLVDENTASAAEIVASALQHYDRATIVGVQTFGKGSVQRVYEFATGESLRLTVAEWFTPGEEPLQDVGVTPDVVIEPDGSVRDLMPKLVSIFEGERPEPVEATPSAAPATPAG